MYTVLYRWVQPIKDEGWTHFWVEPFIFNAKLLIMKVGSLHKSWIEWMKYMHWMSSSPIRSHSTGNIYKNAMYNMYRNVGSIQQKVGSIQQNVGSTPSALQFQCTVGSLGLLQLSHSTLLNTDTTAPTSLHGQKL